MIWSQTDQSGAKTNFLAGDHVDQWLARSVGGVTSWFLTDRMGTPQAIVKNDSSVVEKYDYSSFGSPLIGTGLSLPQIGFTGREFDQETGLMYYRARYYDPNMGRFLSEDPIGLSPSGKEIGSNKKFKIQPFKAGDSNLNRYVGNKPYKFLDPTGENIFESRLIRQYYIAQVAIGLTFAATSVGKFAWLCYKLYDDETVEYTNSISFGMTVIANTYTVIFNGPVVFKMQQTGCDFKIVVYSFAVNPENDRI
ncbi:MAG: RHS repeat-associated core domain-containing protein [Verrucomicrobiota bacterium]